MKQAYTACTHLPASHSVGVQPGTTPPVSGKRSAANSSMFYDARRAVVAYLS